MDQWQDRLDGISSRAASVREVLNKIETTAAMLGIDFCDESMRSSASTLWDQALSLGLCQCSSLTLAPTALSSGKLGRHEIRLRWLAFVAHLALDRPGLARQVSPCQFHLTERELEVLLWTAQGKTTLEIAKTLRVSGNTVNFHVRNAMTKLHAKNKTAAAVRAALLGWL